jgi:predicted nucleotidyltransferase
LPQDEAASRKFARGDRAGEAVRCLESHRIAVQSAAERHKLTNPRVFGPTVRGTDTAGSDLDILVDPLPNATLFDLGGFQDEMEELLGVRIDISHSGRPAGTYP